MIQQNPKVSVIIPVYNQICFLETLLRTLTENIPATIPVEIIVVDDASKEPLEALCQKFGVSYIRNQERLGPAASRNRAVLEAKGDIFFFLDADVEYQKGIIEKVVSLFDNDSELSAVSFINCPYTKKDGYVKNFGSVLEYYWFQGFFSKPADKYAVIRGFTTRNGAVLRKAFEAIQGFDTSFKTNAIEDYDFGKRLGCQFKSILLKEPLIYHNFPASFFRVMRNYFIRSLLWVPYFLRTRPPLDPTQVSVSEARIRLAGCSLMPAVLGLLLPPPWMYLCLSLLIVLASLYLWGIRGFLWTAWCFSKKISFLLFCLLVHYISCFVIVVGSFCGLIFYWFSSRQS